MLDKAIDEILHQPFRDWHERTYTFPKGRITDYFLDCNERDKWLNQILKHIKDNYILTEKK